MGNQITIEGIYNNIKSVPDNQLYDLLNSSNKDVNSFIGRLSIKEIIYLLELTNKSFEQLFLSSQLVYKVNNLEDFKVYLEDVLKIDVATYLKYAPNRIEFYRKFLGMSDAYMLEILDLNKHQYNNLKNLSHHLNVDRIRTLISALGVPFDFLINTESILYNNILPNNIKKIRRKLKVTASMFSKDLHTTRSNLSSVENMRSNLSFPLVSKLIKGYKLSFYDIYDVDNSMQVQQDKLLTQLLINKGFKDGINNNIELICDILNISREEMANYLELSKAVYRKLELGKRGVTTPIAWKLVKRFCVPLEVIIKI